MLSNYFVKKTNTKNFVERLNNLLNELKGKKVIIYGAGEGFLALVEKFPILDLNIVAISDKKFENTCEFKKLKAIPPEKIAQEDFDVILITQEQPWMILDYLENELNIKDKDLQAVFNEEVENERDFLEYLSRLKFEKNFEKLKKKLKNKTVVIYGAGIFFEIIKHYYDLSDINIIAISDRRFITEEVETYMGYKACKPDEIQDLKPDYVVIATKFYINIFEDLSQNLLKYSKIKIVPLVKKSFFELFKEI